MDHLLTRRALLITTTWWSGPAKLAIALSRHGWELEAVCPDDHPFFFVSKIKRCYPYRCINSLRSLLEAVTSSHADLLIPCDDGAVCQLHELHESRPELRPLIERSLGEAAGYSVLTSRAKLTELAESLDIRTPVTQSVVDKSCLREWFQGEGSSAVLKRDGTFGGKGVRIVHSLADAEQAWASLSRPANVVGAALRWLAIRDPLVFWDLRRHPPETVLQRLIVGQPANIMFVCREGEVLAEVTVEVLSTEGVTGAALAVRVIHNQEIRSAADKIASSLKLSGFHGLDFIIEAGTGRAYLIEMNPRCTQLGHLPIAGQGDLAGFLCSDPLGMRSEDRSGISEEIITFFPRCSSSLQRPVSAQDIYVDTPWEEPLLLQELTRCDWRERRWMGRFYYRMRPNKRAAVAWLSETHHADRLEFSVHCGQLD